MALPVKQQMIYWGIALAMFFVILWALGDVILPFLVGGAIAYFLDPVADWLERKGFTRIWATVLISLVAILVVVVAALIVIPLLVSQLTGLIAAAPELFERLRDFLTTRFPQLMDENSPLRDSLAAISETLQSRGGELVNGLLSSAMSVLNFIVFIVVVPVVSFYLLWDWDRMVARVDDLLPRDHRPVIRRLAKDIDRTLASFVRGQGTVCLILGTFYAVSLMIVGLQFGVVVGFVAGLISFIPYVGALFGGALALGLALFQFWGEWWWILAVAAIFQVGQLVEGNILTPNLVGGSVGLHPVWLIFALSAFGSVFGFVGLLVAVPVAAAIGVLIRFGVEQYKQSLLYRGLDNPGDE
ncbi:MULTISPECIES: AI-2E family transporter [Paracoccaceae]|jgi:predicted PurR-regulated permease PerM|uniref:AI-2E family transporter n=1 Tax=Rhodobacterales TaxID=204455 RepID=UPI001B0269C6|nr:AI-2E family transporter [Boseongicola sp. H5]MBO6603625.1 AI-2E family transporter [Roseicyclus sp.]MBO6623329.1 AI-2E family transporter [Roseicyclus sp.]MBO6922176.1 AI-2E family transporter [Roseicyclus sp.]